MSSICPGLIGDVPVSAMRVFLGAHPQLAVEKRLTRQLQSVYPWYSTRKRAKEQANEFLELDLASVDAETMMRYSHVFFVRQQVHEATIDKQLQLLDTGKAPKLADAAVLQALGDCNAETESRLHHEVKQMTAAKKACVIPGRRELDPNLGFHNSDILCMMRCVEEDVCEDVDVEQKCKQFLDANRVAQVASIVQKALLPDAKPLDKKDAKLLQKHILPDYTKVGWTPKYRPIDVTTHLRFTGERSAPKLDDDFGRCVWGHIFRRYATQPSLLKFCGTYSGEKVSNRGDVSPAGQSRIGNLPMNLAEQACKQQLLFSATKFRSQYLYCGVDLARQGWTSDICVPSLRMFPTLGHHAAEDLLARIVVGHFFQVKSNFPGDMNLLDDQVTRQVREFADDVIARRHNNTDHFLQQAIDAIKVLVPPVSDAERQALAGKPAAGAEGEGEEVKDEEAAADEVRADAKSE